MNAAPIPASDEGTPIAKLRASLAAQLALAGGYALHTLTDGSYLVCSHRYTKHCPDLQAVAAFVKQIGGAQ